MPQHPNCRRYRDRTVPRRCTAPAIVPRRTRYEDEFWKRTRLDKNWPSSQYPAGSTKLAMFNGTHAQQNRTAPTSVGRRLGNTSAFSLALPPVLLTNANGASTPGPSAVCSKAYSMVGKQPV